MSENNNNPLQTEEPATAEVRAKKGLSIIWLVPVIALIIGGWLAYKAFSEKGPLISIQFENAEGLEAGKTKLKYKDVVVGEVEEIMLTEQLDGVFVMARMTKEAKPYLTDKTQFWVVRARIAAGEISALGTLLSGAYIGMDPITSGNPTATFVGLEKQPLVTANVPGQHFQLNSPSLGSLNVGSPVFYRQIKVGEVVDYNFDQSGEAVDIKIFIHAPHHERVNTESRFWNASGIDVTMDASGIRVDTQSLISILQGGIAFNTPPSLTTGEDVSENFEFVLHPTQAEAQERNYDLKSYYIMYFDQSVRGLTPGAPVEFRGIPIGEVIDVRLILDTDSKEIRIPVLVMIEPERMEFRSKGEKIEHQMVSDTITNTTQHPLYEGILQHGLRAQLKTGNLLTGQLYIDMDIYPDAKNVELAYKGDYLIFPTVPTPLGQIAEDIGRVLKKINDIPFSELSDNLKETIVTLKMTLEEFRGVAANINQQVLPNLDQTMDGIHQQVLPNLNQTMVQLQETMTSLESSFASDSALNFKAQQALNELTGAIRSVRSVADHLDRNPRALIFGRGESKP